MSTETRRAYGGDVLEVGPSGELNLVCPRAKSWLPRRSRTRTTPEHPGTAIDWDGGVFEVLDAAPLPDGGIRYRLGPWEEKHTIRRMEAYDAASETARSAEQSERRSGIAKRRWSIALAPLAGLLPGTTQARMEREFGAPAVGMTVASALALFVLGFLASLQRLLEGFGGTLGLPPWLSPPLPIALYVVAESALRLASAVGAGEPMGSLPVVAALAAWEARRRPERSAGRAVARMPGEEHDLIDRYRMLEPLLSFLPPAEQRALQKRFAFDPIRWGKITAAILLVVGAGNAVASLLNLAAGTFGAADALGLAAGALLGLEQLARWRRFRAGQPAGSVLGALLRPVTLPFFRASGDLALQDTDTDPP